MSETECANLILDAIDQLRKRKARPDLERICHMLDRRHGVKSAMVNEELTKLVKKGAVIKVDYKGSTSYRNAAKWARMKSHSYGNFYNSSDISTVVLEAVSALTLPVGGQAQLKSASINDIEQYLLRRDSQSNLNVATLQAVLEKEVAKNTIYRLPSGEFVPIIPNIFPDTSTSERSSEDTVNQDSSSASPNHQPPLIDLEDDDDDLDFDWSDNHRCDYCLLTAVANRKGEPELLLKCKECNAKSHPSCLKFTLPEGKTANDIYWRCPNCKSCTKCHGTYPGNCDELLTCESCHTDLHMKCHQPPVAIKPIGIWYCGACEAKQSHLPGRRVVRPLNVPMEEDASAERRVFLKSIEHYPIYIPCAHQWTIENVETFFKFIGFEEEAQAFREQEIDGLSLLLMKRQDVLVGLGIKLGPALKIHNHILKLQSKIREPRHA